MGNIIGGVAVLLLCLVFWVQRDYTSQYGGLFPDILLIVLAVLSLIMIARGVFVRDESGWDTEGRLKPRDLGRAIVLLAAWVASLPILGYLVGGILFFTLVAVLMRTERPRAKDIALDLAVGAGVVGAFYLAFTQLLYVNLPGLSI